MAKPDYDTTLARIAGNIAAGLAQSAYQSIDKPEVRDAVAVVAVEIAQGIVNRVRAITPKAEA